MEFYNEKIRPWLGIAGLVIIGVLMIKEPNMIDNSDISGRKQLLKLIFSYIWGIPAGVLLLVLAGYLGYNQIKSYSKNANEDE